MCAFGNVGNGLAGGGLGHTVCRQPLPILGPVGMVVAPHHVARLCIQPAAKSTELRDGKGRLELLQGS